MTIEPTVLGVYKKQPPVQTNFEAKVFPLISKIRFQEHILGIVEDALGSLKRSVPPQPFHVGESDTRRPTKEVVQENRAVTQFTYVLVCCMVLMPSLLIRIHVVAIGQFIQHVTTPSV